MNGSMTSFFYNSSWASTHGRRVILYGLTRQILLEYKSVTSDAIDRCKLTAYRIQPQCHSSASRRAAVGTSDLHDRNANARGDAKIGRSNARIPVNFPNCQILFFLLFFKSQLIPFPSRLDSRKLWALSSCSACPCLQSWPWERVVRSLRRAIESYTQFWCETAKFLFIQLFPGVVKAVTKTKSKN